MVQKERDLKWFTQRLRELEVCCLYLRWENHHADFAEVPEHLMDPYLLKRKKLLHPQALQEARDEYLVQLRQTHPHLADAYVHYLRTLPHEEALALAEQDYECQVEHPWPLLG